MKQIFVAGWVACAALPGIAAGQGQQVNVFAFEDASCRSWSKSAGNPGLRMQYESWMRGFVSGHNYANPVNQVQIGTFPGSDAVRAYVDAYCKENPQLNFVGAGIRMVEELRRPAPPARKAPSGKPAVKSAPAK